MKISRKAAETQRVGWVLNECLSLSGTVRITMCGRRVSLVPRSTQRYLICPRWGLFRNLFLTSAF